MDEKEIILLQQINFINMRILFLLMSFLMLGLISPVSASVMISPLPAGNTTDLANKYNNKEKKQKLSEFKKRMKALRHRENTDDRTLLLAILAIILPPLAVYIHQNELNTKFWVSLILTLCFWIPGVIFSLLVVLDVI